MNRLLPFALALVAATMCFTACGDDSGSGASDEISVNSSDDEGLDAASSSGKTSKKSSSSKGSSAKSSGGASSADVILSSSQGRLSSSSVAAGTDRGSSSSGAASKTSSSSTSLSKKCKEDEEGQTKRVVSTGIRYVCEGGLWVEISSSSEAESSSSYFDMTNQFNPDVEYGEFTDPRDGQTYRTLNIQFGYDDVDSIEAFAQNLNYGKQVKLGTLDFDDNVVEKFCYNDDPWYCDNGFGGLYSWSETLGLPKACDSVRVGSTESCPKVTGVVSTCSLVQGSCPDGWHVMNEREWTIMRGGSMRPAVSSCRRSRVATI